MEFDQGACHTCFLSVNSRVFLGCCRCGKSTCAGLCDGLSVFSSVQSLLALDTHLAFLLVEAKDKQNPIAQKLFENLFGVAFEHRFKKVLNDHPISRVVIAPLRWGRVLQGGWHPAVFFEKRLMEICRRQKVILEMPHPVFRRRQARLSAEIRDAHVDKLLSGQPLMERPSGLLDTHTLILDDVLTSGKSALELCCHRRARTSAVSQNSVQHSVQHWHLLTLFRTPRPT